MNRRLSIAVAALLAGAACGDAAFAPSRETQDPGSACAASTLTLVATPPLLSRGASELVELSWEVDRPLDGVEAVLLSGVGGEIEVRLPMSGRGTRRFTASALNPYGPGAPAGGVTVVVEIHGCDGLSGATTSFQLQ